MKPVIKIDKGIPIPGSTPRQHKYPWDQMKKVGDSFLVPKANYTKEINARTSLISSASAWSMRWANGERKFKIHKVPEGLRCWRIK